MICADSLKPLVSPTVPLVILLLACAPAPSAASQPTVMEISRKSYSTHLSLEVAKVAFALFFFFFFASKQLKVCSPLSVKPGFLIDFFFS